jgi:hypothetical protein
MLLLTEIRVRHKLRLPLAIGYVHLAGSQEQCTLIFQDDLHDQFGTWPVAYIPYGGADFGEVSAIANQVGDGDDAAFHEAWIGYASRLSEQAEEALQRSHVQSARDLFLRASAFYAASYHPLYGDPVDPRLLAAFRN